MRERCWVRFPSFTLFIFYFLFLYFFLFFFVFIIFYFTWNAKRLSCRAGLSAIAEFLVLLRDADMHSRTCYGNVAGWVAGWVGIRHTPVLYQND